MMSSDPSLLIRKIRYLIQVLILSGLLNLFSFLAFIYWLFGDTHPQYSFETKVVKVEEQPIGLTATKGSSQLLKELIPLSFSQLVHCLSKKGGVDNGCKERDFALACMLSLHHFDLERALPMDLQLKQKRYLSGDYPFVVYIDLTDSDYDRILHFATKEMWPLTAQGLFIQLKKQPNLPGLIETFVLTKEFWAVEQLFKPFASHLNQQQILALTLDADWETLKEVLDFHENSTFSVHEKRRHFLRHYLLAGSSISARLLVELEKEFSVEMLSDQEVLLIIKRIPKKNVASERYIQSILNSSRSTEVIKAAKEWIYGQKEAPPVSLMHQKVSAPKTAQTFTLKKNAPVKVVLPPRTIDYIVQEGDSLWKLSQKFKVDVQEIKKINHLKSDAIKPGTRLRIPSKGH